ncbi:hypothetical protein RI367_004968 [Sorochytrium milnesiophthora]
MAYAILGIFYFIAHPSLWLDALCPFILLLVVSVAVAIGCMFIGFPLLATTLVKHAHMHPAGAWTVAFLVALVLSAIISLILFAALPPAYLTTAFCRTLVLRGCPSGQLIRAKQYKLANSCFRSCQACCRVSILIRLGIAILSLPLHAFPVAGTIAWCYLNGVVMLWEYHQSWFDLYGIPYPQQKVWISRHMAAYSTHGVVAQALEMIPLFNWFFCWTNAVGAALMVADWEERNQVPFVIEAAARLEAAIESAPSTTSTPTPVPAAPATLASSQPLAAGSPPPSYHAAMRSSFQDPRLSSSQFGSTEPLIQP